MIKDTERLLLSFHPIKLEEMDEVSFLERTDTKYILTTDKLIKLLDKLKGKYFVLEINEKRNFSYKTIYFDTPELSMYIDDARGKLNRFKVRQRQYIDTGDTYIEVKFKNNSGKTFKWRETNTLFNHTQSAVIKESLPEHLSNLKPVLENMFNRITLVDIDHTQRVTIDFDITYRTVDNKNMEAQLTNLLVIEVKSNNLTSNSGINKALNDLRIKRTGFSKYCTGIALFNLYPSKKSILKPKLKKLKKLTT